MQDELQTLYTSGTVFHAFLGEKLADWKVTANLVRKIAENYRLPYYTISPTYSICKEHGYLSGEQDVCPKCGRRTEVYSRITGYYRPVQNWNAGKTQEFKDRREYVIETSVLKHGAPLPKQEEECVKNQAPVSDARTILFATPTCPNCKIAVPMLEKAGLPFEKIYANDQPDLAKSFGVMQAPTLVVSDGKEYKKYTGVSEIKNYVNSIK